MPRSQQLVPAFRALIARALRASLLGASLFSIACSSQDDAPLNPNNFSLEEVAAKKDRGVDAMDRAPGAAAPGLLPNTVQQVRIAAAPTRCLAIAENNTIVGNPVIIANCGSSPKQLLKFTSAGEIRTSFNSCIGAYGEVPKVGSAIAIVPCTRKPASRWSYDANQRLANGVGGCFTVKGITLTPGAKAQLQNCASPAPWSQKVLWTTPGVPGVPGPTPPPTTPPPSPTIATIKVSPATNSVARGDSIRLTPTAYNSSGQPVAAAFTWSVASGASFVSVSPQGVVKALNAGTATIAARSAGITGVATITVTLLTPPPTQPPPTQPPPTPPPSGPVPSIPPTLPLATVDVSWRAPTGKTIAVHAGDNLQNALNAAQRGDEVVIDAGATFTGGPYILPAKPGTAANGWITVRTSALSSLPPLGTRINYAQHAAAMPKLVASTVTEVLRTQAGASGWRIVGIEMTVVPNLTWVHNGLVLLGDGSGSQKQLSQVPSDIILDRVYIHGQPSVNLKRCVALNSARTAIVESQLLECHGRGFDAQAIAEWNGPGPYRIENNRLEASGETIIFGGSAPFIQNLVPSDITIRRNYLYRPMSWKGLWTVKNLFELKNAQRVLFEANILENNWVDGQVGFAIVLGSFDTTYPWCIVQDVTVRYNHIDNSAGAFNLVEHYGNALSMRRVALHHNLMTNIGASGLGTNGRMFQLLDGLDDIWIEHNTGFVPTTYITLSSFTKYKNRFTFRNNIGGGSRYNLHSAEAMGAGALAKHLSNPYVFAGNVFVGSSLLMPLGNSYTPTALSLGFVNPVPIGGQWSLSLASLFLKVGIGGATPGVNWTQLVAMTANVRK
ncbi:MAG TPA: ricin-type beta-trefoil lectin domain protein [Gemmatimonadaceae bacterium]